MKRTKVVDILQCTDYGTIVNVKGWVRTHRSSKAVDFIALNDGSTIKNVQIVVDPSKFDEELLKLFKVPRKALAEPRESCSGYGAVLLDPAYLSGAGFDENDIDNLMSLNGVEITGVIGDQPAALLGQNAINEGESKTTYGTGSFTLMNLGTKPVFSKNGLLTSCAWSHKGVTYYALEGSIFQAGSVISWLKDELHLIDSPAECDKYCESIKDTGPQADHQ